MGKVATLTSKSQITIPAEIRRRLGIGPGDKVLLDIEDDRAFLRPLRGTVTDHMEGLGKAVWAREGSAERYLQRERDGWTQD